MTNRTVHLLRTTPSPNTTTLQEHSREKQARKTEVRRTIMMFKTEHNQIKHTTPITVVLHQQQHDHYSDHP